MNPRRTKKLPDGRVYQYTSTPEALAREAEAKKRWHSENYERLSADVPRGTLQRIAEAASRRGISKRKFILDAIEAALKE